MGCSASTAVLHENQALKKKKELMENELKELQKNMQKAIKKEKTESMKREAFIRDGIQKQNNDLQEQLKKEKCRVEILSDMISADQIELEITKERVEAMKVELLAHSFTRERMSKAIAAPDEDIDGEDENGNKTTLTLPYNYKGSIDITPAVQVMMTAILKDGPAALEALEEADHKTTGKLKTTQFLKIIASVVPELSVEGRYALVYKFTDGDDLVDYHQFFHYFTHRTIQKYGRRQTAEEARLAAKTLGRAIEAAQERYRAALGTGTGSGAGVGGLGGGGGYDFDDPPPVNRCLENRKTWPKALIKAAEAVTDAVRDRRIQVRTCFVASDDATLGGVLSSDIFDNALKLSVPDLTKKQRQVLIAHFCQASCKAFMRKYRKMEKRRRRGRGGRGGGYDSEEGDGDFSEDEEDSEDDDDDEEEEDSDLEDAIDRKLRAASRAVMADEKRKRKQKQKQKQKKKGNHSRSRSHSRGRSRGFTNDSYDSMDRSDEDDGDDEEGDGKDGNDEDDDDMVDYVYFLDYFQRQASRRKFLAIARLVQQTGRMKVASRKRKEQLAKQRMRNGEVAQKEQREEEKKRRQAVEREKEGARRLVEQMERRGAGQDSNGKSKVKKKAGPIVVGCVVMVYAKGKTPPTHEDDEHEDGHSSGTDLDHHDDGSDSDHETGQRKGKNKGKGVDRGRGKRGEHGDGHHEDAETEEDGKDGKTKPRKKEKETKRQERKRLKQERAEKLLVWPRKAVVVRVVVKKPKKAKKGENKGGGAGGAPAMEKWYKVEYLNRKKEAGVAESRLELVCDKRADDPDFGKKKKKKGGGGCCKKATDDVADGAHADHPNDNSRPADKGKGTDNSNNRDGPPGGAGAKKNKGGKGGVGGGGLRKRGGGNDSDDSESETWGGGGGGREERKQHGRYHSDDDDDDDDHGGHGRHNGRRKRQLAARSRSRGGGGGGGSSDDEEEDVVERNFKRMAAKRRGARDED